MTQTIPKFELFFALPPELRERILQELCVCPDAVFRINVLTRPYTPGKSPFEASDQDAPDWAFRWPPRELPLPLDLFLTNSQLYQEAAAIFYMQNTFVGLCMARRSNDADPGLASRETGLIASEVARPARMHIRRLRLIVVKCGGFFENDICPKVAEMILSGSLRDLTINLMSPLPRPKAVLTSPFRALFRLLADPDLETASLKTDSRSSDHGARVGARWSWEREENTDFKARTDALDQEGTQMHFVGRFILRSRKFVEVDLNELLDAYKDEDDALRIRRVDYAARRMW